MTEEEIQRNKGAILLELSENAQQLEHWRTETRRMSNELARIASQLLKEPERLVFPNEETDLRFQNKDLFDSSCLDLAKIQRVRDSIRSLELRRKELEKDKITYGIR